MFHTQKSTKSIKITKTQISKQATFLTLGVFYVHKNVVFFDFVYLNAFLCLLCVWNLLVKKKDRGLKLPGYPHLLHYLSSSVFTYGWFIQNVLAHYVLIIFKCDVSNFVRAPQPLAHNTYHNGIFLYFFFSCDVGVYGRM